MSEFFDNYRFDKWIERHGLDCESKAAKSEIAVFCTYIEYKASHEELEYFNKNANDFLLFNYKKLRNDLKLDEVKLSILYANNKSVAMKVIQACIRSKKTNIDLKFFYENLLGYHTPMRELFEFLGVDDAVTYFRSHQYNGSYINTLLEFLAEFEEEEIAVHKKYFLYFICHTFKSYLELDKIMQLFEKAYTLNVEDKKMLYWEATEIDLSRGRDNRSSVVFDLRKCLPISEEEEKEIYEYIGKECLKVRYIFRR